MVVFQKTHHPIVPLAHYHINTLSHHHINTPVVVFQKSAGDYIPFPRLWKAVGEDVPEALENIHSRDASGKEVLLGMNTYFYKRVVPNACITDSLTEEWLQEKKF